MHQANQNLIDRVAQALGVPSAALLHEHPPLWQYVVGLDADCGGGVLR